MTMITSSEISVWDPVVRIGHWILVIGFAAAYFSGDDLLGVHVWAGYAVGVMVALRLVWGVVGSPHARFTDFVYRPAAAPRYLVDLIRFRAPRYLGHSPAGGAMVVALLIALAGTVGTGVATYAVRDHGGPLAGILAGPGVIVSAPPGAHEQSAAEEHAARRARPGHALKEVHEFFSTLTLWLVGFHLAGVLLASVVHRENLVRAIITGRKRPGARDAADD